MSDLRTLLREAAEAVPVPDVPPVSVVEEDLARGRRGLARSRRRRWAAAAPATMAAAAAAVLVLPQLPASGPTPGAAAPITSGASSPSVRTAPSTDGLHGVTLVAYRGEQPAGYTIDKVPEGWEVRGVDEYHLVLGPVGVNDKDNSFAGKITVAKANEGEVAVKRQEETPLTVGQVTGKLFTYDEPLVPKGRPRPAWADEASGARGLLLPAGKGAYLIFQFPSSLHWDAATIADFAAGIHMSGAARAAAG